MVELLAYLRANGFKTFIVSGGGIEFMRPWTEKVYGIPPEQVVGSSIKTKYEMRDGKPVLMRLPEVDFIDDKAGKPVGIKQHIGRRPIAAFGNSDGDQQMLEWTQAGSGARLMMLVHHDDAVREFAYGAESKIGTFSDALMAEQKEQLDGHQHEGRLEENFRLREIETTLIYFIPTLTTLTNQAFLMSHDHETKYTKKKLHQDWRFIVAVVLMLIAIIVYVMTMDDRIVPGPASANPSATAVP